MWPSFVAFALRTARTAPMPCLKLSRVQVSRASAFPIHPCPDTMCLVRPGPPIYLLPPELLIQIFDEAIAAAVEGVVVTGQQFYLKTDVRDRIASVSVLFRAIIRAHPHYWRELHIDCTTTPGFVARHVSNLGMLTIVVHMFLEPISDYTPSESDSDGESEFASDSASSSGSRPPSSSPPPSAPPPPTLDEAAAVVRECLLQALPSVHLWEAADIWASKDVFLMEVLSVFATTSAPALRTLFFACPSLGFNRRACDGLLIIPPGLFNRDVPNLVSLRLWAATLPWGTSDYFGRLESLNVQDIPALAWPSVPTFVSTLTVSKQLRHLVLGGGGLVADDSLDIREFVMPALVTLTVVYTEDARRFLRVLSAGSFPSLREFTARNFDHVAWASAYSLDFFPQLHRLTVDGGFPYNLSHIPILIRRLRRVFHLDLGRHADMYVRELTRTASVSCPDLRWLSVDEMKIGTLNKFLALRAKDSTRRLHRVDYHHRYDPVSELQLRLFEITASYRSPHTSSCCKVRYPRATNWPTIVQPHPAHKFETVQIAPNMVLSYVTDYVTIKQAPFANVVRVRAKL
ncbi:hypothetical protein DFH06DRAFT_1124220 [Mycena polygramma]|nr:hypothetical protein DFH06DRAFT_1124220 [Mycena polygramma]